MMIRTKRLFKGRFSQLCIVFVMVFAFLFGYKESIYPALIVGDNVQTPVLNSNSLLLESTNSISDNNYAFWFYYNALIFSSITGKFDRVDEISPQPLQLKKNVFAAHWDTGDFKVFNNLTVLGNVAAAGYSCSSDIRFKQNITPYSNALQTIMSLQGITYDWNVDKFKDRSFTKDRQIGFIAQDVEKVIPELVKTDEQGFKSVDYSKLSVVLVEAFKEQKKQSDAKISALEKENAGLKQRLASLEKMSDRIAKLESMMKQQKAVLAAR
jgi:hypothetical protein